ncbi:MAG: S8 family serine peptidase [Pseudomonadota bacterium]
MPEKFIRFTAVAVLAFATTGAGAAPDIASGEYFNQPYLAGIKVVPAWNAGLLGAGFIIADLDSGVRATHIDLLGRIAAGGYDFVNDDDDPDDDEDSITDGHGTASAGVIVGNWNGVGIGGIAPSAQILPVKISNDQNISSGDLIRKGFDFVAGKPGVRIILLEAVKTSLSPAEFASLQLAVANGKLVIAPSGNGGQASPYSPSNNFATLGGAALVVGSHNGANLSTFSNGAAGVENNFLTAPGENVVVAGNRADDFYFRVDGTSMAAPQVAAAAALIWAYSPGLTAAEVASILKRTATDLGTPGVDSVTGAGALNIEAALAPIGIVTAPVEDDEDSEESEDDESSDEDGESDSDDADSEGSDSGGSGGSGAGVALAALVVGGVGYALLGNNSDLEETLVLDEYGRTYELDLETRITIRDPGPSAQSVLKELNTEQVNETLIQRSDLQMTASYTTNSADALWLVGSDDAVDSERLVRMSMSATYSNGTRYAFGVNKSLTGFHNSLSGQTDTSGLVSAFQTDAFSAPLAGFTDMGYHGAVGFVSTMGWQGGLSFAFTDDQRRYGLKSDGSAVHTGFRHDRWGIGLRLGLLEEDGNLLGGASGGALSVSHARTVSGVLRGHLDFGHKWSVVGKYTEGLTWVDDYSASLVRDFSEIQSNSWGIGLVGRDLFSAGDAFGAAWSQPLRTRDGDARVSVPYWNSALGGIDFKVARTSLVPDGIEQTFELFYRKPLGSRARLITYLVHREQPLHRRGSGGRTSLVGAWQIDFSSH